MIPPLIHQTWKSRALPPEMERYRDSWLRFNPKCEYRFYDDADCLAFVDRHYPEYAAAYRTLPHAIERADFFRYLVVHQCGGLYADVDMECLRPFDCFFTMRGAVLGTEMHLTGMRRHELRYRHSYQVANCIFAAEPGHPFLGALIRKIADLSPATFRNDAAIEDATGPRMLTRLYFSLSPQEREGIHLLPQICWLPPTRYPKRWPFNIWMYARHHFFGSWKTRDDTPLPLRRWWIEQSKPPNPWPRQVFPDYIARSESVFLR